MTCFRHHKLNWGKNNIIMAKAREPSAIKMKAPWAYHCYLQYFIHYLTISYDFQSNYRINDLVTPVK